MVFIQKVAIFVNFFLGNIILENVFCDILEGKNASLGYKTRSSKSPKIDIFPKGLTHSFAPQMAIFPTVLFRKYRPGKYLLRYFRTKNRLSRLQKQVVQKVEKTDIFPKGLTHGFGRKMAIFPTFFF